MIYISTGCTSSNKITQSIEKISSWGFSNIELTGGFNREDYSFFEKEVLNSLCSLSLSAREPRFMSSLDMETVLKKR